MNQILSMDPNNNSGFGNNYNNMNMNGGNNGGGKLDNTTNKRIFAIGLIIFGLVMFISGIIGTVNYFAGPKGPVIEYPIISTMQQDNILTLSVKNDVPIDYIEYSWNDDPTLEIAGNNSEEIIRDITIPVGENIFYMNVVDINGKSTPVNKTFVGVQIEDKTPPEIELVVVGSKLNISARTVSETKLSYLTYKWNNDEEIRLDAQDDQSSIQTSVDVPNGDNTITVVVVNEKGISQTKVAEYKGVKKPVIQVKQDEDGEYLEVTITHEEAVKSADVIFNGKNVSLTPDRFGKPVVEFKLKMIDGNNTLKIVATSVNDATETFNGTATKR